MNLPAPFSGAPIVSAAELRRNFGLWQERVTQSPVLVLRHGKPRLVLCSTEQFSAAGVASVETVVERAIAAIPEHSSEALIVLDRQLNILAVNRVLEDNVGLPARLLVGASWPQLFPTAADSLVAAHFRQVLRTGQPCQFETPSVIHAGRHYAVTVFPHAEGIAALFVNQTAEAMMREADEARISFDASFAKLGRAACLRLNPRGCILEASPQFAAMTGYEIGDTGAPRLTEIVSLGYRAGVVAALEAVLGGHEIDPLRAELLTSGGDALAVELGMAPLWRGPAPDGATVFLLRA